MLQSDLELSAVYLLAVDLVVSLDQSYLALEIRTCSPIRLTYALKDRTDGLAARRQLVEHYRIGQQLVGHFGLLVQSVVDPVQYSKYDVDRPKMLPVGKMPDCGLDLDFLRLAGLAVAVVAVGQQAEVYPHLDGGVLAVDYLGMMQAVVWRLLTSIQKLPVRCDICRLWLTKADYPVEQKRRNDVLLPGTENDLQELLKILE